MLDRCIIIITGYQASRFQLSYAGTNNLRELMALNGFGMDVDYDPTQDPDLDQLLEYD